MKTIVTSLIFMLTCPLVHAQDLAQVSREQLKALRYFAGNWRGEATIQQRGGPPMKVLQEERIEWRLDSLVLTIEGTGRDPVTQKKVFQAFAVVAYNPQTQQLGMKSFTLEGRQTEAYFKVVEENKFEWGFDLPNGKAKIKYTITLSPQSKSWYEKGEYSPDGAAWFPTIQMNLTKQN